MSPTHPTDRIAFIDALRGFALVGIYFVNITAMGGPIDSDQPAGAPSLANAGWIVWLFDHLFVHGAMRGVFSMLFGASALLFLRAPSRTPQQFAVRCAWLFLFGVVNSTLLLWPGDILLVYALASPIVLVFRDAPTRRLLAAACLLLVAIAVIGFLRRVGASGNDAIDAASASAELTRERAARLGGYFDTLNFMWSTSLDWTLTVGFVWWVLDAAAFMLIGMALFRNGVLTGAAATRTYLALLAFGFGLGLPLRAWEAATAWRAGGEFPAVTAFTFQFGRLATTLGWVGAFALFWRYFPSRRSFAPFSALGRMALTGYLLQSLVAATIFSGFGLGLWNSFGWAGMWALVPAIMAPMSAAFIFWLRRFRMGPVEWAWRYLTFGAAPTLRQAPPASGV